MHRFRQVLFPGLRTALVAVLLLSPLSAGAAEQNLTALLGDYRALAVGPRAVAASGQEVTLGRLTLKFFDGHIVPLVSPSGEVLGLYFEGAGRYSYACEDPTDLQVLDAHLKSNSARWLLEAGKLTDAMTRTVVFFAQPVFEGLLSGADAPTPSTAAEGFRIIWKRVDATYLAYDHLAADARLNGGGRQFAYAEMEGGQQIVGYTLDPVRSRSERLFFFRSIQGYDVRFIVPLSRQTLDKAGQDKRPPLAHLRHVDIDVATTDNRSAQIVTVATLEAGPEPVHIVPLSLLNNRSNYQFDWRAAKNRLEVRKVTDEAGRELPFSHRYHEILVQLAEPLAPGAKTDLRFETEGEILTGLDGERHDNYFQLFDDVWFPMTFEWQSVGMTSHLEIRTRKPYRPIASGQVVRSEEDKDGYYLETREERPTTDIAVFAGKYTSVEQKFGDRTIRCHGYGLVDKRVLDKMPKVANDFIAHYEKSLGPYPFDELNVVEVPEYGFGIAPPSMVLITSEAFKPQERSPLATYLSHGADALLAHEIAHQWFGHKAIPATSRDNWLSESLAEYVSGMAVAVLIGKTPRFKGFEEIFAGWWGDTLASRDDGPLIAANEMGGNDPSGDRFRLLYSRGPMVLRMLHAQVGNERFYAILRKYLENANMGYVTSQDFQRAAEEVLQAKMDRFFQEWVYEGGVPVVKVDHRVTGNVLEGTAAIQGEPFKHVAIPFVLEFGGKPGQVRWVEMSEPTTRFRFELPAPPTKVEIDPARNILAEFK